METLASFFRFFLNIPILGGFFALAYTAFGLIPAVIVVALTQLALGSIGVTFEPSDAPIDENPSLAIILLMVSVIVTLWIEMLEEFLTVSFTEPLGLIPLRYVGYLMIVLSAGAVFIFYPLAVLGVV